MVLRLSGRSGPAVPLLAVWVLWAPAASAAPEPSFRCSGSLTPLQQAICASEDLATSEKLLADRITDLRSRLSPDSFATVATTQAEWLRFVAAMCLRADSPEPTTCLIERYSERFDLLDLPSVSAGALRLEGRVRFRTDLKAGSWQEDAFPIAVAGPKAAVTAFNAQVTRDLRLDRPLADFRDTDPTLAWSIYHRRDYELATADSRLVSILVSEHWYSGGAEGGQAQRNLNWNVERSRPLQFEDLFRAGAPWREAAVRACRENLREQLELDADSNDPAPEAVDRVVGRLENWTFRPGEATIGFPAGSVAPVAKGDFEVALPLGSLEAFWAPTAPVPRAP